MKKLIWQFNSPLDPAFLLVRHEFPPKRKALLHTHDCAEITLVDSGEGRQTINGSVLALKPGDLFLIRPTDCHSFAAGKHGLVLINLAFPTSHALELENRYLPDDLRYFRSTEELPWSTHLDAGPYAEVESLFTHLDGAVHNRFELERALINLFAILQKPFSDLPLFHAPNWLRHACAEMHQPTLLAEGLPALLRLAGRSPGHTARELRKHSGCTPTEFINRLRIEHAARLLRSTDKSVLETALDCGFENQGYFHRCFKARFGTTPLAYRKKHHSLIF